MFRLVMRLPFSMARLGRALVTAVVLAGTVLLVLWLMGVFADKVPPDAEVQSPLPSAQGLETFTARAVKVPVIDESVGSIRAAHEVSIASRLLARVAVMHVTAAGQRVQKGEVLVELEDADLKARVLEARAAAKEAEEAFQQSERDLARTRDLHKQDIASESELETQSTRFERARSTAEAARQAAASAETQLDYSIIRAPIDGVVIDKAVEQGDTVVPGQLVVTMYDPTRMQLVAAVREERATTLKVGDDVRVAIDALGLDCHGTVSEIVPQAAAGSRSFDVKVTGPCPDGVFTGMFGRLLLKLGEREEIRIPKSAIQSIGQVDLVYAVVDGRVLRRFVVPGRDTDGDVEILSGVAPGDVLVRSAQAFVAREDHR